MTACALLVAVAALIVVAKVAVTTAQPDYDGDGDGIISKSEVIAAINDYLFGDGSLSKEELVRIINLYLYPPAPARVYVPPTATRTPTATATATPTSTPTPTATPTPSPEPTLSPEEQIVAELVGDDGCISQDERYAGAEVISRVNIFEIDQELAYRLLRAAYCE